jgi:hypothetical protein
MLDAGAHRNVDARRGAAENISSPWIPYGAAVLTEALPLAAAGSIYPVAFAAIVAMLGGANPMRRALFFLTGGVIVSFIGYIAIVTLIRAIDFTPGQHPKIAATVKLLLGVALLAYAARTVMRRRKAVVEVMEEKLARDAQNTPSTAETATAVPEPPLEEPSVRRAFITGAIVYFPGVFLIASANAIASAKATAAATFVAIVMCTILLLLIVEVPILAFAIAPERVRPPMERITTLGKIYSKQLILAAALVAGLYLVIASIAALS